MNGDNGESGDDDLSLDACLELLSNRKRRAIVGHFLASESDHAPVDELIATLEGAGATTAASPDRDSVVAAMAHVHLPKLADAGVIDYDARTLEVRYLGDPTVEQLYGAVSALE